MPVPRSSDLETVSLVLGKDQVRRLRALHALRSSAWSRVSFSEIAREVVEAGLVAILRAPDSTKSASNETDEAEAAA